MPISHYVQKMSTVADPAPSASKTATIEEKLPIDLNPNDIRIELVEEKDAEGVLKLLKTYFFKVMIGRLFHLLLCKIKHIYISFISHLYRYWFRVVLIEMFVWNCSSYVYPLLSESSTKSSPFAISALPFQPRTKEWEMWHYYKHYANIWPRSISL